MIFFTIITSLLIGISQIPVNGAEILDSEISLKNGIINYQFNASVNATPNAVFSILSDYKYLPHLNKHIKSSAQKSRGTKTIRVFKLEKCILNFCFDLNFEEEMINRFGLIPSEFKNLIELVKLKVLAASTKIIRIDASQDNIYIYFK